MSTIIENRNQRYVLSCYVGTDGKYHVSFSPCSFTNNRVEDHTFTSASEAEDCYNKNVLYYTGKEAKC